MNILPSPVYYERYPRLLHTPHLLADHSALYKQALSLLMLYPSFAIYDLFRIFTRSLCTSSDPPSTCCVTGTYSLYVPKSDCFDAHRPTLACFCISDVHIHESLPCRPAVATTSFADQNFEVDIVYMLVEHLLYCRLYLAKICRPSKLPHATSSLPQRPTLSSNLYIR